MSLPTGVVTFLLSDIEASTAGWEADRAAMARAVARHYDILEAAIAAAGGARPVEQGEGDSVVAAFVLASDALRAAIEIQLALAGEPWPDGTALSVRIALHTGEATLRDQGNYFGPSIIRCARLRGLAHGGQILCSRATADLVVDTLPDGADLDDLGLHRLKGLARPEHVYGVTHRDLPAGFPPLRSSGSVDTLPTQLTSFVGREAELAELARVLAGHRLLTLTGSGGVGKTRLAVRAAADLVVGYPDGVWWVDLAPLTDPALLPEAVLTALGLGDTAATSTLERLLLHLAGRELLLVLDNCEHLVDATAGLLDPVLRRCPGVRVMATSREALGIPDEVVWRVPSMGPDAVELFVERSVKVRPNFSVEDPAVLAEICARLDGIPLAIELAAARSRVLTPHQILAELEDRFRLLVGGTRRALARQQTLEASVAWSHDLLAEDERVLFRRLAVFSGGFTLDAAEAVAPAGGPEIEATEVLDLLEMLIAKSMVVLVDDPDASSGRYRLLETMRAFAARELGRAGETASAREGHLAYYARLLSAWERDLVGVTPAVLRRFVVDADNYRVALDWALSGEDCDAAVDLVVGWGAVCVIRSRYREAEQWATRVVALPALSSVSRVDALWVLGAAQVCLGDVPGVQQSAAEALCLTQNDQRPRVLARMYHLQSLAAMFVDPEATLAAVEAATPCAEEAGDLLVLLDLELNRAFALMRADDVRGAQSAFEGSHTLATRLGNEFFGAYNHGFEALLALRAGSLARARAAASTGLRLASGLGEMGAIALATTALAEIELVSGSLDRALEWADEALASGAETGGAQTQDYITTIRGRVLSAQGRHDEARAALAESLRAAVDAKDPWPHAQAALALGRELADHGEAAAVPELVDVARACARRLRSPWVAAVADHVEGRAADDLATAEDLHHAALAVHVAQGYALDVVDTLEALADLAARQESWAESARLFGATAARRADLGYRLGEPTADAVREALGEDAFTAASCEGAALSIEAAVAYASRARGERGRPTHGWASLTPTELDVARLAAQGASNPEIGRALFVSPHTVKTHLSHVYAKLGLANRAELAAEATRREA